MNGRTDIPRPSLTGFYALAGAVTMAFMALTSAMAVRRTLGDDWSGIPLPPVLWLNTVVLVASSAAIHFGRTRAAAGLGALFLTGQYMAWRDIAIAASPGNSFFWVFTTLHALHLAGGLAAFLLVRPAVARLYWHLLTAIWIYLLALFALWGNG
ncbi:MAG: hypothetical protein R2729_09800 [Bryobacteraceae bacterium]